MTVTFRPSPGWRWRSEVGARASHHQGFSSQGQSNLADSDAASRAESWRAAIPGLNERAARELNSLCQERNPELFHASLLAFADRLLATDQPNAAAQIYQKLLVVANLDPKVAGLARDRLSALLGQGGFGAEAELMLKQVERSATDYRLIVPMFAGSLVYQASRGLALRQLAGLSESSWISRGWGARATASLAASAVEIPAFTLAQFALRGDAEANQGFHLDLARNALSLGMMKLAGMGHTFFPKRLARFDPSWIGLAAAEQLEKRVGLRDSGSGSFAQLLGTYFSLKAGAHLGARVLGPAYLEFQRAQNASTVNPFRSRLEEMFSPVTASAGIGTVKLPRTESRALLPRPLLSERFGEGDEAPVPTRMDKALVKIPDEPSIPEARVITDQGRENIRLDPDFGLRKQLLVTAAAFAAFPLPLAISIAACYFLIGKIGPELLQRLGELQTAPLLGSGSHPQLPERTWYSSTYRREPVFLSLVTNIEKNLRPQYRERAARAGMSVGVYLARALEGQGPVETEAWLNAEIHNQVEWIRAARHPGGIPLLMDIAQDPDMETSLRKSAIDGLAQLFARDATDLLKRLLSEPELQLSAAGALLWLDLDDLRAESFASLMKHRHWSLDDLKSWTESFFAVRYLLAHRSESRIGVDQLVSILGRNLAFGSAYWPVESIIEPNGKFRQFIFDAFNAWYQGDPVRPAVLEALLDRGYRQLVIDQANRDQRETDHGFSFTFRGQKQPVAFEHFDTITLARWGRVAGKLGFKQSALDMLRDQELKLKTSALREPETYLELAESYIKLDAPERAIPLLEPMLRHWQTSLALRAAHLMDRASPGWDRDLLHP